MQNNSGISNREEICFFTTRHLQHESHLGTSLYSPQKICVLLETRERVLYQKIFPPFLHFAASKKSLKVAKKKKKERRLWKGKSKGGESISGRKKVWGGGGGLLCRKFSIPRRRKRRRKRKRGLGKHFVINWRGGGRRKERKEAWHYNVSAEIAILKKYYSTHIFETFFKNK